jgi:CheY-like chemotaxis protein
MDGWEFLEEYAKLNFNEKDTSVVLLTSSIDPSDILKAENIKSVSDFKSKPLSMDMIDSLVNKYLN